MFIIFSGLDCSGKSTQINLLNKEFEKRNEKSFVFWSRGGYTPGFQFLKDSLRKVAKKKLPEPGFSPERKKALSNPFVLKLWLTIAMIDLIIFYAIYLRFKHIIGYNIICDRYIMDTNIDFNLTYPDQKIEKWILWKILNFFACKADFHFVSTIPVKESVRRSKFKFEPYPDPPEILKKRLNIYNSKMDKDSSLIHLNGMESIEEIKYKIHSLLF